MQLRHAEQQPVSHLNISTCPEEPSSSGVTLQSTKPVFCSRKSSADFTIKVPIEQPSGIVALFSLKKFARWWNEDFFEAQFFVSEIT